MSVSKECREWLDEQENEFMQPVAEWLSEFDAREYTGDESAEAGWYSRLSAPGYLDCTDWQGPYENEDEALEGLFEVFGD